MKEIHITAARAYGKSPVDIYGTCDGTKFHYTTPYEIRQDMIMMIEGCFLHWMEKVTESFREWARAELGTDTTGTPVEEELQNALMDGVFI